MRSTLFALGVLATLAALMLTGYLAPTADAATGPHPAQLQPRCLENLINQYLAALVARDSSRLPLSKDLMYTGRRSKAAATTPTSSRTRISARWLSWEPCVKPANRC